MFNNRNYFLRSGDLAVSIAGHDKHALDQAFLLRHKIFAERLGWVEKNNNFKDEDEYDKGSIIFVASKKNHDKILGTFRITPHKEVFMLEKAFENLKQNVELIKNQQTVELSRLVVDPDIKDGVLRKKLPLMLYRALYVWCSKNSVRYIYMVSTKRYLRRLSEKLRIPIHKLSNSELTADGEEYYTGMIDLKEARKSMGFFKFMIFRYMRL